ncbi:TonB-dependent receptor plug domain-containing protein [Ketobacter sp. MCCC 1A13808]|uniref:TonB-dependent receptor n=1 Tax=Ketobacter sp. MCCC 1A13808 TaxID=2602738 RepID=UPI000F230634|nr:TonB-dependent receptor [Ketobacter sp. MCCC 1A13808]MVF14729.1 TonB-dependent receptor plug domain-containing protein [Ketobacter sp. MCCC 1A13808]RLP55919.1 MAG: TonB-dependent siderophore receptor [Ketobacter sp.]
MTKPNNGSQRPISLRSRDQFRGQKTTLALGISALIMSPVVMAEEDTIELDKMQIEDRAIDTNPYAEPGAPYKARVSSDARHVKPLAETPQTITVITETQIQDSGRSDLREVLQAQPGITLGTGENGNAFGDRYIIRGHEARSDVFVDGLRDPGMTIRESFATEQVEVTKGPSSTFAGRGSTGGAVNSATKQASTEYNFTELQGGFGTDQYYRLTADTNQVLTDNLAVRVNVLGAAEEVPDRGPADRERTGIALSAAFTATEKLSFIADYYHLQADDKPDLGTYILPDGGKPVDDIPVYLQNADFLESTVDTFTFRMNYDVSDNFRVQNSIRYGTTDNGYVVTGARGSDNLATVPPTPTIGLSDHQGWQEVEYLADQLNFYVDTESANGIRNQFVFGMEYSDLKVQNGLYKVTDSAATNCVLSGRGGSQRSAYCIVDANGAIVPDIHNFTGRTIEKDRQDSDFNVETVSLYVMDTVDLTEKASVFMGIRYDDFDYQNTLTGDDGDQTDYSYSDGLWNGHVGVVYDITEHGNIYATWSTSSNINGGESDLGGNCGYGGLCGDPIQVTENKPETTTNLELGTKWNVMEEKLLATLAIFQIKKEDVMESVGDDYATIGTINTGANEVKGIEASLTGNITERLSSQFGVAIMEAEITESYNVETIGQTLSNFADESAYFQLRYQFTDQFAFGGVVTYSSEMYAGQPDSAPGYNEAIGDYSYTVPSYTVLDLFATYDITDSLNARLNLMNVTDEDYYLAAYRSGAFTYIGDAPRAMLTFTYQL